MAAIEEIGLSSPALLAVATDLRQRAREAKDDAVANGLLRLAVRFRNWA